MFSIAARTAVAGAGCRRCDAVRPASPLALLGGRSTEAFEASGGSPERSTTMPKPLLHKGRLEGQRQLTVLG
jgi:hypothetical protein